MRFGARVQYNATMQNTPEKQIGAFPREEGMLSGYLLTLVIFLLGMALLWVLGVESVYDHPAPFYALLLPATENFATLALTLALWAGVVLLSNRMVAVRGGFWRQEGAWLVGLAGVATILCAILAVRNGVALNLQELAAHALVVAVGGGGLLAVLFILQHTRFFTDNPKPFRAGYFLLGLFLFAVVFACALAMLRGGMSGIAAPYTRVQYEYVGDIGVTSGIRDLFRRYNEISSYLTLHSRAAPPGPIAILWGFTYLLGNDPLALALCTVIFGSVAIVPFYFWVRELATERIAVIACLLYVFCPGIILFTATSAEILFMPFSLVTLCFFERAIRRGSPIAAIIAGIGFGMMAHLKFTLLGLGIYFALVGLRYMAQPEKRYAVMQTAALMAVSSLGVIGAVWLWSGFDLLTCLQQAKAHFDLDQALLDEITPRYPGWVFRFLNPLAWFFFAGIPVSVLFCASLFRKHRYSAECIILLLTLFFWNLLHMHRGEVERSALYMYVLLMPPAAMLLDRFIARQRTSVPLFIALAFMLLQCWAIETLFYTYW